ncbi:unnamed protein product, partial [Rotaria sp. Silwood1]
MHGKSKVPKAQPSSEGNPIELTGNHFPSLIPSTA